MELTGHRGEPIIIILLNGYRFKLPSKLISLYSTINAALRRHQSGFFVQKKAVNLQQVNVQNVSVWRVLSGEGDNHFILPPLSAQGLPQKRVQKDYKSQGSGRPGRKPYHQDWTGQLHSLSLHKINRINIPAVVVGRVLRVKSYIPSWRAIDS